MSDHFTEHGAERSMAGYLHVLRARKLVVVGTTLCAVALALIASLLQGKLYQATVDVVLTQDDYVSALVDNAGGVATDPVRAAQTQARLARSPDLVARVIKVAGRRDLAPSELIAHSSVVANPSADILSFRVEDSTPEDAAELASTYAREFTRYRNQIQTASLRRAKRQLDLQAAQLRRRGRADTPLYGEIQSDQRRIQVLLALRSPGTTLIRDVDPARQIQPTTVRNIVLGALLGLLLGVGVAFLLDALDTRVRSELEITSALGVPLLARIPKSPGRTGAALTPPGELEAAIEAEAFRMLRANLQLATLDHEARILLVTSAVPGEGKSTAVANLGVALARAGRDVILADIDLRKPSLHRIFGLGRHGGLTDIARRSTDVDRALVEVAIDRSGHATVLRRARTGPTTTRRKKADESSTLRVLPAGPPPPAPGEFVESELVSQVLMDLRAESDIVLVDAPPLLTVGDATSLSMQADTLLLVVRPELLRRAQLEDLRRTLESIPTPAVGFVTVGAESNVPEYYYGMSVSEPEPRWRSLLAWGKRRLSRPLGPLGQGAAPKGAPAPSGRSRASRPDVPGEGPDRTGATESPPVISVPTLPIRDAAAHRPTRGGPVAHDDATAPER